MTPETLNLGRRLARAGSVPESIQVAICIGALVSFAAAWRLNLASVPVLLGGAVGGTLALLAVVRCIPALRSSLTIYERGLELIVRGTSTVLTYDELNCIAAKFTHHLLNHQYVGTTVKIEFSVDGRLQPYIYNGEFRRDSRAQRVVSLAIEACSRAIQTRLLDGLEREGAVPWRDNISLTAEGIMLTDSATASRVIPYTEISDWKIWKADDALPFLVMGNDTPNFVPLFALFESLCSAARKTAPRREAEPVLA